MAEHEWLQDAARIVGAAFGDLGEDADPGLGMRAILGNLQRDPVRGRAVLAGMIRRVGEELAQGERPLEFVCGLLGVLIGMLRVVQEAGG